MDRKDIREDDGKTTVSVEFHNKPKKGVKYEEVQAQINPLTEKEEVLVPIDGKTEVTIVTDETK